MSKQLQKNENSSLDVNPKNKSTARKSQNLHAILEALKMNPEDRSK